jgi:hypothetical protein
VTTARKRTSERLALVPQRAAAARLMRPDRFGFVDLILWHDGDPSVGISGDQAEVHVWVGEDPEHQAFVRETLCAAFSTMWDSRAKCMEAYETVGDE